MTTPIIASARVKHSKTWHQSQKESLTPGERAADSMRNLMGSWAFVGGFFAFMALWAALGTKGA